MPSQETSEYHLGQNRSDLQFTHIKKVDELRLVLGRLSTPCIGQTRDVMRLLVKVLP